MLNRKANTKKRLTSRTNLNIGGLASTFGKSGSIKSCISSTSNNTFLDFSQFLKRQDKIKIKEIKYYNIEKFDNNLKSQTPNHANIYKYFEKYPYVKKTENYIFNKNTPYSIIRLYQKDFNEGTVRLTKPGIYVLQENIVFNPNEDNDFFPKPSQMNKYPMGNKGPFHLGFFAAITVEGKNIILNLNNKTIKQSKLHNIQQRFYATIELASSPFIPKQGPGNFGATISFAKNVVIKNGTLGLSSHHGIHGNKMENVIMQNLNIVDFEVAGISLNGANNCVIYKSNMLGTSTNIKVLSTYSSARFIRKFLKNVKAGGASRSLNLVNGNKTIDQIINELETTMTGVVQSVKNGTNVPLSLFKNLSGLYDGNVYGITLNRVGVLVNDFITTLGKASTGNRNNVILDVIIKNIISEPLEIVGISCPDPVTGAYGKGVQVGPVGDVFQVSNAANNDGTYKENILANAKLILGKYNNPKNGTTCISPEVLHWSQTGNLDIQSVAQNNNRYFTVGEDSMAHKMKGNIGLFISSGENITVKNVTIDKVKSLGYNVGVDKLLPSVDKKASISYGSVVTGSKDVILENLNIDNVLSDNSSAYGLMIKSSVNVVPEKLTVKKLVTNDNNSTTNIILQN